MISPSDPSSAWTAKANKRVLFGYGLNYLIDVEHAIIVDVEATPAPPQPGGNPGGQPPAGPGPSTGSPQPKCKKAKKGATAAKKCKRKKK